MKILKYIYISLIAIVVSLLVSSCDDYLVPQSDGKYKEFSVNGVSFNMVFVEGGSFIMGATFEQGSEALDNEKPAHQVTLDDYYIADTEVTQELWIAVMGSNPSYFNGNNLPVGKVTWNDCQEFIEKLNIATNGVRPKGFVFQLPTEAEWEYAARGGNKSKGYKYSGSSDIDRVAYYTENGCVINQVATKFPNELGLYDMSGNVGEWCSDWYGDYSSGSQTNPNGLSTGSKRVLRGGSGFSDAIDCRVSSRRSEDPSSKSFMLGLRLALAEGEEVEFEYKTYSVNGVSFDMVAVEGGTFTMGATTEQGSDADDDEKPTHKVTLSDYMIGKTEVTQELWQAVMGSNPSYFNGDNLPVEQVSYSDCQEFIERLNIVTKDIRPKGMAFRLPTEAEWEYAARGGNKSKGYKYSGGNSVGLLAWYWDNSLSKTHVIATKSPNELGLYDMSGNVWEWCSDWYGEYSSDSQTNPKGTSESYSCVFRGGSWNRDSKDCRVSNRHNDSPDCRSAYLGFRLVLAEGEEQEFEYNTYTVNGVSFDMVAVEGGTFTMGATSEQGGDAWDNEKPAHNVTLSDYMIAKTEVTQGLWIAVMGTNPSYFKGYDLPVESVSWDDCQEFIKKLNSITGFNFRLPTEAEWEYAARGGNKSKGYKYSGSDNLGSVAWYYENSGISILDEDNRVSDIEKTNKNQTHIVAIKLPNELGIYDMSGNVDEWCSDYWWGSYSSDSQIDPKGPSSGYYRLYRGGNWKNYSRICRVSYRYFYHPGDKTTYIGLRLAL